MRTAIIAMAALVLTAAAQAGEASVVLGNDSQLRGFLVYRTPVMVSGGELKPCPDPNAKDGKPLAEFQSPLPPADWAKPEFDDSGWARQRTPVEMRCGQTGPGGGDSGLHMATINSMILARAAFEVTDPAAAGELKLWVEYVGGVVVRVNGEEVARGHLPAGEVKPDTLAEKYPDELYVAADGTYQGIKRGKLATNGRYYAWQMEWSDSEYSLADQANFDRRYRVCEAVVPAKVLRKGTNVLAIEIHRAPVSEGAMKAKRPASASGWRAGFWAGAGLSSLKLTSASGAGVVPNTARPKGVQVWTVGPLDTLDAFSYGDPGEVRPLVVNAAVNGVFSGRIGVGSASDISGLKVAVGELKQTGGAGAIPASAVQVRYAAPATPADSWLLPAHRFNALAEAIPAKIPALKAAAPQRGVNVLGMAPATGQPAGAVACIWLTVRVPKTAAAGTYDGAVTVSADGLAPVRVPMQVKVSGWALPDPKDFRQRHLAFLSQESVAKHYEVPLWSEKHFELMGKSMALLAEINSHEVPINLDINFYGGNKGGADSGNAETMVYWVKQPDGSYKHDFTVFDKYLDCVAKYGGKPCPIRLNCWHGGWAVTAKDPATGKLEELKQPGPIGEEGYQFWKPVIDEALAKLKARGWLDVTAFGHNAYCEAVKPERVAVAKKLWPDGVWAYTAHNGTLGGSWPTTDKSVTMPVKYSVGVWTQGDLRPRGYRALLKPRPGVWCNTARNRHYDNWTLPAIRNLAEEIVQRGQDGLGDFGGDMFPVKKARGEGYYMLGCGRGTGGPNDATHAILAPGPDGAIATERFEALREGTEICEGLLYLEAALQDKKIGGELAAKVNRYLDERADVFINNWYHRTVGIEFGGGAAFVNRWTPPLQAERDAELLALCGEVAKVVK
ncbi:MAG TPA: DUF6067 family protein [Planctomycetota bacterium]|nr:DUF6067 family protein [Planctomycetota bacterium]